MSRTEGSFIPKKYAPFIYFAQPKSESPHSITVTVEGPKKPLGFADWPEDPKPEWKKA